MTENDVLVGIELAHVEDFHRLHLGEAHARSIKATRLDVSNSHKGCLRRRYCEIVVAEKSRLRDEPCKLRNSTGQTSASSRSSRNRGISPPPSSPSASG